MREVAHDYRQQDAGGHVQPLVEHVHRERHGHDDPTPSALRVVVLLERGHFGLDHHRAQYFAAAGQVAACRQPGVQVRVHVYRSRRGFCRRRSIRRRRSRCPIYSTVLYGPITVNVARVAATTRAAAPRPTVIR